MVDLTALRTAPDRNPTIVPWGRDHRLAGLDDVQVTVPGTPPFLTPSFLLGPTSGRYTLLGALGIVGGAMVGSAVAAWLDFTGVALLVMMIAWAATGWALLGLVLTHVLTVQTQARLGLPSTQRLPLSTVVHSVSDQSSTVRRLIGQLEDASATFLASDGELDDAFVRSVAAVVVALEWRTPAGFHDAQRQLETLLDHGNDF